MYMDSTLRLLGSRIEEFFASETLFGKLKELKELRKLKTRPSRIVILPVVNRWQLKGSYQQDIRL